MASQIEAISLNSSNSHSVGYQDSGTNPPTTGIELGTSYPHPFRIDHAGNYTLTVLTLTDLTRPFFLADTIRKNFTVIQLSSVVTRGDVSLEISSPYPNYSVRQIVPITLKLTNNGNTDLTITGVGGGSPLSIKLQKISTGGYANTLPQSESCEQYLEGTVQNIPLDSNALTLSAGTSLVYHCDCDFVAKDRTEYGLQLIASGELSGELESGSAEKHSLTTNDEGIISIITEDITIRKTLIEFIPRS